MVSYSIDSAFTINGFAADGTLVYLQPYHPKTQEVFTSREDYISFMSEYYPDVALVE